MTPVKDLLEDLDRHLQSDERPSVFLNALAERPEIREEPLRMLAKLRTTEQNPVYHPEGSVWNHTLMVVDRAAEHKQESRDPPVFLWAALLHDIGKPATTQLRKGKITSYDHDLIGAKLAVKFLRHLTADDVFLEKVAGLVRWHMQILFVSKESGCRRIAEMARQTDVREVALLGLCDRLGRLHADEAAERRNVRIFLEKCCPQSGAGTAMDEMAQGK